MYDLDEADVRLILPVPRLSIPAEDLAQPIPKLSDRQHVVEKLKKTAEQARADRELFWYRERLLSSLEATWIEVSRADVNGEVPGRG